MLSGVSSVYHEGCGVKVGHTRLPVPAPVCARASGLMCRDAPSPALLHPNRMPVVPAHPLSPSLPAAGLRFLRALKRNNDRDWFNARKSTYEVEVQAPWLAVIDAVNAAFADFAPEYVKPPRKAALRIYRDIRFSPNKNPYKTNAAAWWSTTTQERTSGGGFYAQAGADGVTIAAGVYQPLPPQLLAIRRHLQTHHAELRALLASKKLRTLLPDLDSNPLQRMPKGFLPDDPAGDLLLHRQWALSVTLPAEAALDTGFVKEVVTRFRAAAPMVALLNAPLLAANRARKSMF